MVCGHTRSQSLNQLRHLVFTAPEPIRVRFKDRPQIGLIKEAAARCAHIQDVHRARQTMRSERRGSNRARHGHLRVIANRTTATLAPGQSRRPDPFLWSLAFEDIRPTTAYLPRSEPVAGSDSRGRACIEQAPILTSFRLQKRIALERGSRLNRNGLLGRNHVRTLPGQRLFDDLPERCLHVNRTDVPVTLEPFGDLVDS